MNGEDKAESVLKELTLHMTRAIVNQPDQVRVEEVEGATMIVLELRVAPDDIGRVIGRRGQVANAMRILLPPRGVGLHAAIIFAKMNVLK